MTQLCDVRVIGAGNEDFNRDVVRDRHISPTSKKTGFYAYIARRFFITSPVTSNLHIPAFVQQQALMLCIQVMLPSIYKSRIFSFSVIFRAQQKQCVQTTKTIRLLKTTQFRLSNTQTKVTIYYQYWFLLINLPLYIQQYFCLEGLLQILNSDYMIYLIENAKMR